MLTTEQQQLLNAIKLHEPIPSLLLISKIFDFQEEDGRTPLHIAVDANNKLAFGKLIEHGVCLDILDNAGFAPLDYAKFKGWNTEEFVNNGKNSERFIEIKPEQEKIVFNNEYLESDNGAMLEGRTPSHIAVLKGQTEYITDLIKGGVNKININDNNITIAEEPKPLFGQFKSACHEKHFDKHTSYT